MLSDSLGATPCPSYKEANGPIPHPYIVVDHTPVRADRGTILRLYGCGIGPFASL